MLTSTAHSIELKTREPLPKGVAGAWARTVADHGPANITAETEIRSGGEVKNSRLYCVKGKGGYHYVVPLARDLTETEADAIAEAWHAAFTEGDFVINWSQEQQLDDSIRESQEKMMISIAEEAAKRYHTNWYNQRVSENWSFGHKLDTKSRKHPMLQPWENLPDRFKLSERERIDALIGVLESMNLKISQG
jgi:RyR domain